MWILRTRRQRWYHSQFVSSFRLAICMVELFADAYCREMWIHEVSWITSNISRLSLYLTLCEWMDHCPFLNFNLWHLSCYQGKDDTSFIHTSIDNTHPHYSFIVTLYISIYSQCKIKSTKMWNHANGKHKKTNKTIQTITGFNTCTWLWI